jgi:hypothetical protein
MAISLPNSRGKLYREMRKVFEPQEKAWMKKVSTDLAQWRERRQYTFLHVHCCELVAESFPLSPPPPGAAPPSYCQLYQLKVSKLRMGSHASEVRVLLTLHAWVRFGEES